MLLAGMGFEFVNPTQAQGVATGGNLKTIGFSRIMTAMPRNSALHVQWAAGVMLSRADLNLLEQDVYTLGGQFMRVATSPVAIATKKIKSTITEPVGFDLSQSPNIGKIYGFFDLIISSVPC